MKSNAKGFWSHSTPRYAKPERKINAVGEKWKEFLGDSGRERSLAVGHEGMGSEKSPENVQEMGQPVSDVRLSAVGEKM